MVWLRSRLESCRGDDQPLTLSHRKTRHCKAHLILSSFQTLPPVCSPIAVGPDMQLAPQNQKPSKSKIPWSGTSHSWPSLASALASTLVFLAGDCPSSSSSRSTASSLTAFAAAAAAAAFFLPRPLSAPGVGDAVGSAVLPARALRLVALRTGVAGSAPAPSVAGESVRSFLL